MKPGMNGKKAQIIVGICVFIFSCGVGYAEVKIRSINNEKRSEKNEKVVEDLRKDIRRLLVRQERALTILEDLKRNN